MAVDGGGSRCRVAAFSDAGVVLAQGVVQEHASLSLGVSAAWAHIEAGLELLRKSLDQPRGWLPDQLLMGLAGSLQESRRQQFLALVPAQLPCMLVTDGHAQLLGAGNGKPGICLAIGTGSVLHWLDADGNTGMVGGWGFPVGDEGSGAWLGMRLVQLYLWHRDGRRQSGSLIDAVEQRIGSSVSAVQQWSTQTQSGVLAQLAPLVFAHAAQGDRLALSVLEEAAAYGVAMVELAPDALPVYIVGGIGDQLRPLLAASLGSRILHAEGDALHGLWLMSRSDDAQLPSVPA
jgi:glucosamine kinase